MKKMVTIVFAFLVAMITVCATAEVTFNGAEFLSTDDMVLRTLTEKGLIKHNTLSAFSKEDSTYLVSDDSFGYRPTFISNYQDVCFAQSFSGLSKIAGYPVKELVLSYAYNGSYRLISVKVDLFGADYESLYEKLTRAYGTAEIKASEEEGIISNIWQDGKTAVVLYTENEGLDYTLMYGRTDTEEILANCLVVDPDDISGL